MLKELSQHEISQVCGAGMVEEYYPPALPGYEIVGWSKELIGYDSWIEYPSIFTQREVIVPIYEILPIYAPIVTVIYY